MNVCIQPSVGAKDGLSLLSKLKRLSKTKLEYRKMYLLSHLCVFVYFLVFSIEQHQYTYQLSTIRSVFQGEV